MYFLLLYLLYSLLPILRFPTAGADESWNIYNNFESDVTSNHQRNKYFSEAGINLNQRPDILKKGGVSQYFIHQLVFAIRQHNLKVLEERVTEISSPNNQNYGQFLSREDVANLTTNMKSRDSLMLYFKGYGEEVVSISESLYSEYVVVEATISLWERLLNTKFYTYFQRNNDEKSQDIVRCEKYTLPPEIVNHVSYVFNTVQMPFVRNYQKTKMNKLNFEPKVSNPNQGLRKSSINSQTDPDSKIVIGKSFRGSKTKVKLNELDPTVKNNYPGIINPAFLRSVYSVYGYGSSRSTQGIFETAADNFSGFADRLTGCCTRGQTIQIWTLRVE